MTNNILTEPLKTAVNQLANTIQFSEAVSRYLTAQKEFKTDQSAHQLLEELSETQKLFRQKQMENKVTSEDLEKLRSLQAKAQENKVITDYAYSQQIAIGHLREINAEISSLLGIDFATLAKNTSC